MWSCIVRAVLDPNQWRQRGSPVRPRPRRAVLWAARFALPLQMGSWPVKQSPRWGKKADDVDAVRKLITDKLDEKGLSMKEASFAIGRNEAYLHQFINRGSPVELVEREREILGRLLGISPDDLRGPNNPLPSPQRRRCSAASNAPFGFAIGRDRHRGVAREVPPIRTSASNDHRQAAQQSRRRHRQKHP
jgi:hypothetical protein